MKTLAGLCRRLGRWQFLGLSFVFLWAIGWAFPCGCLGLDFWQPKEFQLMEIPTGCSVHTLDGKWLDEKGRPVNTKWTSAFARYETKEPAFLGATPHETYIESQIHYELREVSEVGLVVNLVSPSPGFSRYVSADPFPKPPELPLWYSTEEETKKRYRIWRSEVSHYWRSANAFIPSSGSLIDSDRYAKTEPLQPIPSVGSWNVNKGPLPEATYFLKAPYPKFPYWNIRHWNQGSSSIISSTHMLIPSVDSDDLLPWTAQHRKFTEFQTRAEHKYAEAIAYRVCGSVEWETHIAAIHGQRYYVMPLKENGEKFLLCDLRQMKTQNAPHKK